MKEKASILVKRSSGILAWYEVGSVDYDGEEDFIRKREQVRELLGRIKFEKMEVES